MAASERVFVDSNYFVALYNKSDSLHPNALAIAKEIESHGTALVISNYTFLEIVTVLSQKRGRVPSVAAGSFLLSYVLLDIIHIDKDLHSDAWNIFKSVEDKNISFVDCSTIALMRSESIQKILTFDHTDFKTLQNKFRF